jgi:hypothetical protein
MNTQDKTMEQLARELARSLEADVEEHQRLQDADDSDAADEKYEELADRALSIDTRIRIDVLLYTGGPAGGIEFDCERNGSYLEWTSARVWHQDWFQEKGYWSLDRDTADWLWNMWGLEYYQP